MTSTRIAPAVGLAICGAATVWWVASTALLDTGGADPVRLATKLLAALFAARLLAIALLGPVLGGAARPAVAALALAALVATSWPLVLLGAWAGGSRSAVAVLAEAALLIAAVAAVALGRVLHRSGFARGGDATIPAAAGAVAAAILWEMRATWLAWLSP